MALVAEAYDRLTNENKEEKKVFFLRLDYEYSQKVFQNYQVNSVPLLFHIAPHLGADKVGQEYEISSRDRFQISAVVEAEAIASFMSDHTGVSVSIKRSMIFAYIMLLVLFAIVLLAVKPIIDTLPFWLGLIQTKNLWLAVSYGVYTCAISGLIFDIIRSPQM